MEHAGTMRFLEQCEPDTGDYTAERHKWLDSLDMETIMQGIQAVTASETSTRFL